MKILLKKFPPFLNVMNLVYFYITLIFKPYHYASFAYLLILFFDLFVSFSIDLIWSFLCSITQFSILLL